MIPRKLDEVDFITAVVSCGKETSVIKGIVLGDEDYFVMFGRVHSTLIAAEAMKYIRASSRFTSEIDYFDYHTGLLRSKPTTEVAEVFVFDENDDELIFQWGEELYDPENAIQITVLSLR